MRRTDEEAHVCRKVRGFYRRPVGVSRVETHGKTRVSGDSAAPRSTPPDAVRRMDSGARNKQPSIGTATQQMGFQAPGFNILWGTAVCGPMAVPIRPESTPQARLAKTCRTHWPTIGRGAMPAPAVLDEPRKTPVQQAW
jgi:hypothetical protein